MLCTTRLESYIYMEIIQGVFEGNFKEIRTLVLEKNKVCICDTPCVCDDTARREESNLYQLGDN